MSQTNCPECNHKNDSAVSACLECGYPLASKPVALINCPDCRQEVNEKAISCPECGFPVAEHLKYLITCSKCSHEYDGNSATCPNCKFPTIKVLEANARRLIDEKNNETQVYSDPSHSLISCPECSHKLKDTETSCPECGFPINEGMSKTPEIHTPLIKEPLPVMREEQQFLPAVDFDAIKRQWDNFCGFVKRIALKLLSATIVAKDVILASLKEFSGTATLAARLSAKHATKQKLLRHDLRYAHLYLGKAIRRDKLYQDEFHGYHRKLDGIQAEIDSLTEEKPSGNPRTFADRTRLVARQTKERALLESVKLVRRSALRELGNLAYERFAEKCEPADMTQVVRTAHSRIAELDEEITAIETTSKGRIITPKRLAISVATVTLCFGFLGLYIFFSGDSGSIAATNKQSVSPANHPLIPQLIESLSDDRPEVAAQSARALGAIGPAAIEAVPVLEEMHDAGDPSRRAAAQTAMRDILSDNGEDGPTIPVRIEGGSFFVRGTKVDAKTIADWSTIIDADVVIKSAPDVRVSTLVELEGTLKSRNIKFSR